MTPLRPASLRRPGPSIEPPSGALPLPDPSEGIGPAFCNARQPPLPIAGMDDVAVSARPRGRIPAVNVALFLTTVATTLCMGFLASPLARGPFSEQVTEALRGGLPAAAALASEVVRGGFPFAGALVAILLAHEMGHYVLARRHGVDATLPFFIPVPFGAGTLGAVIRIRSPLPSRRATLEIGAAGPIAGFLLALPLLLWGLAHSEVVSIAERAGAFPASPYQALHAWLTGAAVSGELTGYGESALTWLAARLLHGPIPAGAVIAVHPVAFAAWLGLYVTALNLVPLGQLDGGHVLYALLGRRAARAGSRVVSAGLLAAGLFFSWAWLVWWVLTRFVVGLGHPPALQEEPLSPAHRALAVLSLVLFALTFVPVPFS